MTACPLTRADRWPLTLDLETGPSYSSGCWLRTLLNTHGTVVPPGGELLGQHFLVLPHQSENSRVTIKQDGESRTEDHHSVRLREALSASRIEGTVWGRWEQHRHPPRVSNKAALSLPGQLL